MGATGERGTRGRRLASRGHGRCRGRGELAGTNKLREGTATITHLPQVAAKGDSHYRVYKEDDETSTHTRISELTGQERVEAIAVMLGGQTVDRHALAAAKSLLRNK